MNQFQIWLDDLQRVHDDVVVRNVIGKFAASLEPVAMALPDDVRSVIVLGDVNEAAVTLLQAEITFSGSREVASLLHEIAHVYAAAAVRLSRIRAERSREQR